jgi:hypothetical protein
VLLTAFAIAILAGSALAATGNLVKNGSFEKDSNGDGIPNKWVPGTLAPTDKRVCNQSSAGSCSFRMVGDGSGKQLSQVIDVSGDASDEFTLSAWTRGKTIVLGAGAARVYVQFNHTGGGSNNNIVDIPAGTTTWTLRQLPAQATADFDSIYVSVYLGADSGKMWVDQVKLVPAP